ncbi:MAG: acyltransferase [Pseudarcicella sp.]|nr:acyltransferase [Pseudarcicella sp.]MBP6409792.1 acyltransferase [Pseudarcicella sp.]
MKKLSTQNSTTFRLRELDFLRGVAIILVLMRHIKLSTFTEKIGWVGVDLFFVLSGFLVSGLLFKEYIKFGNIKPKLFLIRRGFKIYPIYFIFYILYLIPIYFKHDLNIIGVLSDITFTQNYYNGWGYACGATWSLAVEEHFYFGLTFLLWLGLKTNINFLDSKSTKSPKVKFVTIILALMTLVFLFRFFSNIINPQNVVRHFTMTHLRIDSLLAGVLIAYFFYFKRNVLDLFFDKTSTYLFIFCLAGLSWIPFFDPLPSFFVKTFGFTILYISFAIILITFLLKRDINDILNKCLTAPVVNLISKVGYCSYSIYIIHIFCKWFYEKSISHFLKIETNIYLDFIIISMFSIITGMIMTFKIEKYFLDIRDKYYPSRV